MRALDTSVLARWLLNDDPKQSAIAEQLLAQRVWVSQTVMLELGWVLFKALQLPRPVVAAMLQQIVDLDTADVENSDALDWAISRFRRGADWADMVHIAACPGEASQFATFDRRLERQAGTSPPTPVEIL